jgi:hypothetical protein
MTWPQCNDAKMLRLSLSSAQLRTVRIIQAVGFGVIQGLAIRDGHPSYDPRPRIMQSIKMGSHSEAVRFERGYIQPTDDELRQLDAALQRLIRAKAAIQEAAAAHGWPLGGL